MLLTLAACNDNTDTINIDDVDINTALSSDAPTAEPEPIEPEPTEQPLPNESSGVFYHFYTLGFSVEFPAFWEGKFSVDNTSFELDEGPVDIAGIYHIATRDELYILHGFEYGGRILTLGRATGEHFTYDNAPIMAGGSIFLAQTGGYTYFVNFPSGVEHNTDDPYSEAAVEYLEMIGNWEPSHWDFLIDSFMLIDTTGTSLEQSGQPTDAEIEAFYNKAVEAMSWFRMASMPADYEDTTTDEDGNIYYRVVVDGINSLADLEAHLHTIFATDIVEDLMDFRHHPVMYRDFDGVLHTVGGARGGDITRGDEVHEIIRTTREHHGYDFMVYRVIVDILGGENLDEVIDYELYDFSLSRVDGDWIFLNFNLVR